MMGLKIVKDNGRFICCVKKDMIMNQVNLHRGVKKKECFAAWKMF